MTMPVVAPSDPFEDIEPDYDALATGDDMLDLDAFSPEEIDDLFVLSATEEVKNVHQSPPKGKPANRGAYADPKNYKWPIDAKHIRAAVSYYNHGNKSGYDGGMWATIGRRIASAANRLIGKGHSFANGKIATASNGGAGEEYAFLAGREVVPTELRVTVEEIVVNGVPCFQFEAMVVPGDAVSRNTVPGKKGPTYYSNRRVRQYATFNNGIIEEMAAKGQRVTVYPRHAAALLDASLPMGWVDRYDVRPSKRGHGLEDLWYQATVPLTSEGRDAWMKLRTGLIKYSSLRTFADDRFRTEPVKVDGRVVEEAVSLPIAGIDLVATQPGLPVAPIRILEEAAVVEPATEEPMSVPGAPRPQQTPPMPAQMNQQQAQQGQQPPAPAPGGAQVPPQYAQCPNCGGDITHHIQAAHAQMSRAAGQQPPPPQGQAPQGQQQQQQPPAQPRTGREEAAAATEEHPVSDQQPKTDAAAGGAPTTPAAVAAAPATEESQVVAALKAEIAALKAERDERNAALEEASTYVREQKARALALAKAAALVTEDKTMGTQMRPLILAAIEEKGLLTETDVALAYYRIRAERTELLATASRGSLQVPGFGHVSLGASEELLGTPAGNAAAEAGKGVSDPSDPKKKRYDGLAGELRNMFGRVG